MEQPSDFASTDPENIVFQFDLVQTVGAITASDAPLAGDAQPDAAQPADGAQLADTGSTAGDTGDAGMPDVELAMPADAEVFIPDDYPRLVELYGDLLVLVPAVGPVHLAPTAVAKFEVVARCLERVSVAEAAQLLPAEAARALRAGREDAAPVLVGQTALDEGVVRALVEVAEKEGRFIRDQLAGLQAAGAADATQVSRRVRDMIRYFKYMVRAHEERSSHVAPPVGGWNVYTPAGGAPHPDRLTAAIKGYASSAARVFPALPRLAAAELEAALAACRFLMAAGADGTADMATGVAAGAADMAAGADMAADMATGVAAGAGAALARALLTSPAAAQLCRRGDAFAALGRPWADFGTTLLRYLFSEELTFAAQRVRDAPVTRALPFVLTLGELLAMGIPNAPATVDEAAERLDIYVGGYLRDLDLRRSFVTGSAVAASAIITDVEKYHFLLVEYVRYCKRSRWDDLDLWGWDSNWCGMCNVKGPGTSPFSKWLGKNNTLAILAGCARERPREKPRPPRPAKRASHCKKKGPPAEEKKGPPAEEKKGPPAEEWEVPAAFADWHAGGGWRAAYRAYLASHYPAERTAPCAGQDPAVYRQIVMAAATHPDLCRLEFDRAGSILTVRAVFDKNRPRPEVHARTGARPRCRACDMFIRSQLCHQARTPKLSDLKCLLFGEFLGDEPACSHESCFECGGRWPRADKLEFRFEVRPGADVDISVDVATNAEFDVVATGHYTAIQRKWPGAVLRKVARDSDGERYNWSVECPTSPAFRGVEIYRASFNHVVTHHVGMVSAAFTAALTPGEPPQFVGSARFALAMSELATPNYYYFASRKTPPQYVVMKYLNRGFGADSFPAGIWRALGATFGIDPDWSNIGGYCVLRNAHPYPAAVAKGYYSAYALPTELAYADRRSAEDRQAPPRLARPPRAPAPARRSASRDPEPEPKSDPCPELLDSPSVRSGDGSNDGTNDGSGDDSSDGSGDNSPDVKLE